MKGFLDKHRLKVIKSLKGKRIYIDPGHGGSDPGGIGNGLIERDINLVMAFALAKLLRYLEADIKLSRTNNSTEKSLKQRCNEALDWDADLLISVHNNAGGGDGFEAIHTIFEERSIGDDVAKSIGRAVVEYTDQNVRRIFSKENSKGRDWYGINRLSGHIPSIITEGAFLDHTEDVKIIDTVEEQQYFGYVIGIGISTYFGVLEEIKEAPDNEMTLAIDQVINGLINIKKLLKKM